MPPKGHFLFPCKNDEAKINLFEILNHFYVVKWLFLSLSNTKSQFWSKMVLFSRFSTYTMIDW